MRILRVLLHISCYLPTIALAQKVSVSNMNKNVVSIGKDNPLTIMVEQQSCQSISVTTDNGAIKKTGPCTYDYRPSRLGMAQIVVSAPGRNPYNYIVRVEKDAKGGSEYHTIDEQIGVPTTVALISIGNVMSGNIAKDYIAAQQGLIIRDKTGVISKRYKISSFQYAAYRQGVPLFHGVNAGVTFGDKMISHLNYLQAGDVFIIFNSKIVSGDKSIFITPLEFYIQ